VIKVATAFSGGLAACEFGMKYEELEHEVVFACEWDKYARKQYLHFHGEPTSQFYEDIHDLDATPYKYQIDLFVFGSPCQDLSLAGKRKGFLGEKSSLFRHGARVLEEMMPRVFIFENVKGLLSSNGGADYKEVVDTFQSLGYLIAMKVVNAKDQGTAQNRERVFVVGFLNEDEYHNFSFADDIPLDKCLRDYLEDEVDEKYFLSQKMIDGFIVHKKRHVVRGNGFKFKPKNRSEIASCLGTKAGTRATDNYIEEPMLEQVGELDIKGADSIKRVYSQEGLCPTMTTMGGGSRQPKVFLPAVAVKSATKDGYELATENDSINFTHPDSKTRRGRVGKGVAQTLDCACNQGVIATQLGNSKNRGNFIGDEKTAFYLRASEPNGVILNNFRIRRLTPRECFRLMAVDDCDISLVNSDTQSYKIAGNGIEVNTVRSILRQLYKPVKSVYSLF